MVVGRRSRPESPGARSSPVHAEDRFRRATRLRARRRLPSVFEAEVEVTLPVFVTRAG